VEFAGAGIRLQSGSLRLVRVDAAWAQLAEQIVRSLRAALGGVAEAVEHVGSTAVPGLVAKPILDFAIGVPAGVALEAVIDPTSRLGWIYRGDAGADGGWVFVLEDAPWNRVAHAHVVEHGGEQWQGYLQLRQVLRESSGARRAYEHTKQRLAAEFPNDRERYTAGKTRTVQRLLRGGV
jgi:GrpB-like predicted nucleotidyltransferase (UPF0157 family)